MTDDQIQEAHDRCLAFEEFGFQGSMNAEGVMATDLSSVEAKNLVTVALCGKLQICNMSGNPTEEFVKSGQ
jgi:hypothetical protein